MGRFLVSGDDSSSSNRRTTTMSLGATVEISECVVATATTTTTEASSVVIETTETNAWLDDNDDADDDAADDARFAPLVAMATEKAKKESEKSSASVKIKRMALAATLPALAGDDDEFGINDTPIVVAMTTNAPADSLQAPDAVVVPAAAAAAAAAPAKPKKKKRVVVEAGGQSDFDLITNLLGGTSDLVDVVDEADAYRGPVVRRDWDRIAQRRAALRAAKSPEDRAELRKQFRLEDAMAGDAQATSDPLFMPRTKSSKQQKIVVQPTDAFGLGAFVGGGGENLPQQQQQQVAADASPAKAKSATNAKKMQREQEERRQRLQMEQEKLLREQAVEIPTVLSNAPPPSRLTDARALFRAIMTRKIPILSGADVDERLNGFNIDLDDANWANHKSLRAAQPADASEGAGEQRVSLPTNDEHVDEAAASADGEGDASSSSSSSSSRSRSLIGATAASVAPLPNEQSDSDDELVDDDDDDEPTMELPRGPSMSMATLGDDGDCCPLPTFTQTQVELTAEATLAIADADGGDEDDDADEDEEEAVTQAAKSRSLKKRAADDDDESSSAAMHAAAMLDNEADEASGDESSGGDDDDDDGAELIVEDGADAAVASDQAGLHAQLTFEQDYVASFGGGDDDESDGRKRKRGGVQRSDDAEDDGSRVVRRRRRGGSDAAASSDDDDGNDDVDHNATAVRPPSMQLRDDDGGDDVASVVGDRHQQHQQHDDESEEVDDATKQRIRERVQARAAKNDFFAAHGDGLGRSQSNSLFPISDDHSQHALARVVLLNESSQSMVVAPPRSRALLRSSSFLVPLDIDLQQSGRTSAGPIESLFSKVVGRTGAMAPPSARPAATTTATATATTGQKADTPRSPMSRSKSMTDVAAVGTMRRSFSAVNPQRLRELTASHNRVVQNTSSRSVLFASDSQDGRTQPGNAPSTVSSSGGSQQPVSSFFSQLMHKSK